MATVDATMMKVQRILTGPMDLKIQLKGDLIGVQFEGVSTDMQIRIVDWGKTKDGDPRTLVVLSSPILWAVPPSAALYEWVARESSKQFFGHVRVQDDPNNPGKMFLAMSHTLLGDYLDEEELASALWGILTAADHWDDELQKKFGGKRLLDVRAGK